MYYVHLALYRMGEHRWLVAALTLLLPLLYLLNWRAMRRRVYGGKILICLLTGLALSAALTQILPMPKGKAQPVSVTLSTQLVMDAHEISVEYGVPFDVLLAIMHHESGFIPDIPDNINANGTKDRGLCQINEVNWQWLGDRGLDVSLPRDNMEGAAIILSGYLERYTLRQALAAYAAGPGGMRKGKGLRFAGEILAQCQAGLILPDGLDYL